MPTERKDALVIGAGGQSRVVISILRDVGFYNIRGILDLSSSKPDEVIMGVPVLGNLSILATLKLSKNTDLFLAIGSNLVRKELWSRLLAEGYSLPNLISPFALIDPSVKIATANIICPRAFIGPEVVMGANNIINTGAIIEHEAIVASHCHFAPGSIVAGRANISNECLLGAGATVLPEVRVKERATIGASALVLNDVCMEGVTIVGVPGKELLKKIRPQ